MSPERINKLADPHAAVRGAIDRRTLLVAGGLSFCGMSLPALVSRPAAAAPSSSTGKAKSTILIWLGGGASHIDTWDMKPNAPENIRGPFQQVETSAPGLQFCEHLPMLSERAHQLAVIRSLGHYRRGTGDHHAGYYYNLTGHHPDPSFPALLNARKPRPTDWPAIGTVVGAKSPPHPYLPQSITLPSKPGAPEYTRPGQFAARLGVEHDPLYVLGDAEDPMKFAAPAIELMGDVSVDRLYARRELLDELNRTEREFDQFAGIGTLQTFQEKAFSLLGSGKAKSAFDLSGEPDSAIERYGKTHNGMSMLMARRLVEAGVPFVEVSAGNWDTHQDNFERTGTLCNQVDQPFAFLLEDLRQRGLLEQTLVVWMGEFGRTPRINARSGRDHYPRAYNIALAGAGVRGGQVIGTTDPGGVGVEDRPVGTADLLRTIFQAVQVDADHENMSNVGRPITVVDGGEAVGEVFSG